MQWRVGGATLDELRESFSQERLLELMWKSSLSLAFSQSLLFLWHSRCIERLQRANCAAKPRWWRSPRASERGSSQGRRITGCGTNEIGKLCQQKRLTLHASRVNDRCLSPRSGRLLGRSSLTWVVTADLTVTSVSLLHMPCVQCVAGHKCDSDCVCFEPELA